MLPARPGLRQQMLIDIGANLTHPAFDNDIEAVLARARAAGLEHVVVTGTSVEESGRARMLASRHPGLLSSTAGVHPHHAGEFRPETIPALQSLAAHPGVAAIGECGLDFNRNYAPHPAQEACFLAQLELACALGKPLFLHSRDAYPRMAEILSAHRHGLPPAVAHCFTGERAELFAYLDLGLHIGITGWICDERRGRHLLDLLREIPLQRLMLETDSPYLTPRDMKPQPKSRRNEPAFLPHVAATVARALGRPPEEIARATSETAQRFFGLRAQAASDLSA